MSRRPRFEVADVFHGFGADYIAKYGATLLPEHRRVMLAIESCRTAALGGHVEACDACDHHRIAYNSCANRHCPKCQSLERARWVEARSADLLPVPYFHVVFTLPSEIAHLALQNKTVVYGILFAAAARTLTTIAADPRHLGAHIGLLAILHTWGQTLTHHPHLHCIVPGGGLSPDRSRWIRCRSKRFFVSVRVLSRLFRRLFLEQLKSSFRRGELGFHGQLAHLADPNVFGRFIASQRHLPWVVYAKRPFGGPERVLKYLGRYTHRVAISNHRITNISDSTVTIRWKDYNDGCEKLLSLSVHEFIRRFLLHVLPSGFHRIRCFGFLANACRAKSLALIRRLLGVTRPPANRLDHCRTAAETLEVLTGDSIDRCPKCHSGRMRIIDTIPRPRFVSPSSILPDLLAAPRSALFDSS